VRATVCRRLSALLPQGRLLPDDVWRRRHRAIVQLAVVQAGVLGIMALLRGDNVRAAVVLAVMVAAPVTVAILPQSGRVVRAAASTLSLMLASAALVQMWGGLTEAHFHFFVMVGVVSLYQEWVPFGVALAVVVCHHGVVGTIYPHAVFDHHSAHTHPWAWAGIHAAFVLAASLAHLAAWRLNEEQGLRDPLTGLGNRTLLVETADRLLRRPSEPVSVLVLDVDDFKDVNDARGHTVGDALLVAIGERLRGCVRPGDEAVRLGGDEFAVVVAADPVESRKVGERMLRALADPFPIEGRPVGVHVSIGVADAGTAAERSAATLLRNADLAMYMAKARGKNRLAAYADGMAEAAQSKVELLEDLAGAAAAGQLQVFYQPTVSLADGSTTGYEALLRWNHPARGLVSPTEFIPLAEDGGHIVEIGRWVLTQATLQAASWSRRTDWPIAMAVNVSPRQLADDDIVQVVSQALQASGLPARQLTLEVTEGVLVRDVDRVVDRLRALRTLGVRIAIDDFGTGFSSLSYLRRLPADIIKIDRSFVQDLGSGGASTTLVASIIELARSLHLDVVAEGVETAEQQSELERLSCSHAQGFLFGRPRPAADHDGSAASVRPSAKARVLVD
jgi:diguanylate cyclase (GGDEF)-like protein